MSSLIFLDTNSDIRKQLLLKSLSAGLSSILTIGKLCTLVRFYEFSMNVSTLNWWNFKENGKSIRQVRELGHLLLELWTLFLFIFTKIWNISDQSSLLFHRLKSKQVDLYNTHNDFFFFLFSYNLHGILLLWIHVL